MLLEFTVENYRSIKEPVTLSAVAQKSRKPQAGKKRDRFKTDDEICSGFEVAGWDLKVLPVMAIFGANASGKSNVLQAFSYLILLMQGAYDQERAFLFSLSPAPFSLDKNYKCQPTKFDLRVFRDGYIYHYHLEILGRKVLKESLDYMTGSTKRSRKLFHRRWSEEASKYLWENGESFVGAHMQLEPQLPEFELFITILARLQVAITLPFCCFLTFSLSNRSTLPIHLRNQVDADTLDRQDLAYIRDSNIKDSIVTILKKFDTGIFDIEFRKSSMGREPEIYAIHQTITGETVAWRFEEESLGTQYLFGFAYSIAMALGLGGSLTVDELGANIHPQITSYIIQLFQNPKTNPRGAQLIFTSHDNTIQRNQLLRRDQIWFTEKKPDQSTDLYSLAEFKVRNDLAIDKAYLDGRFGAVPFLPETVEELLGVE